MIATCSCPIGFERRLLVRDPMRPLGHVLASLPSLLWFICLPSSITVYRTFESILERKSIPPSVAHNAFLWPCLVMLKPNAWQFYRLAHIFWYILSSCLRKWAVLSQHRSFLENSTSKIKKWVVFVKSKKKFNNNKKQNIWAKSAFDINMRSVRKSILYW